MSISCIQFYSMDLLKVINIGKTNNKKNSYFYYYIEKNALLSQKKFTMKELVIKKILINIDYLMSHDIYRIPIT